jgi:hypothetical protein
MRDALRGIDDRGYHHLAPEKAEAARAHGHVLWNKNAVLFLASFACLPEAEPDFLQQQHQNMLQNPAVHQKLKQMHPLELFELR